MAVSSVCEQDQAGELSKSQLAIPDTDTDADIETDIEIDADTDADIATDPQSRLAENCWCEVCSLTSGDLLWLQQANTDWIKQVLLLIIQILHESKIPGIMVV